MAEMRPRTVTIDVLPSHCARLKPYLPEVQELLLRRRISFDNHGPCGVTITPEYTDRFVERYELSEYDAANGRISRTEVMRLPQGLVDEVRQWLEERGDRVEIRDAREDSEQWVRASGWRSHTASALRPVVAAVGAQRALRVISPTMDATFATIAAVARAYPDARIAVGVVTYSQLRQAMGRLRWRLGGEPLGVYTAKRKQPARVSVGLIHQLPRGNAGAFDLLVLPFAEESVGDETLRVSTSGQFRRLLSFTRTRWTPDENINRRLMVVAGSVFPPLKPTVPVTAVVLDTHGTSPAGAFDDPIDAKRQLYWHNGRRNRRIAEVAKRLMVGTRKAIRSLVENAELVALIQEAARTGVAILVETPVHARTLAELLPGWAVWTANELEVAKPAPGCGVIATELAADETVISAGVLIRAAGTKWPLPEIDWPWFGDVEHGVLIDFKDEYHQLARKNAAARMASYQEEGMSVWEFNATSEKTPT